MEKKRKMLFTAAVMVFLSSTLFFFKTGDSLALTSVWIDEKELGELCVNQVAPTARTAQENAEPSETAEDEKAEDVEESAEHEEAAVKETETEPAQEETVAEEPAVTTTDPLVIIYHTHSSESYMPYKESNYHREEEEGTVRDVGTVLERELEKKGINVIHDKTIHDRPSYNESYTRSLETIEKLSSKYPTAVYIIDLHRDAAASSATEGKYIEIDGKRVATFSLVVGKANDNYAQLHDFANHVSDTAESMHEGFGGPLIEKDYNYNEYISDRALLLEVGNNMNTIEEARRGGKYFANVLASIIQEEQKAE